MNLLLAAYNANLGIIEFFSALISAALIAGIITILVKTGYIRLRVDRFKHIVLKTNMPKEQAKKEWARVQHHFFKGDENDLKMAIIEADKLLEEALTESGIRGTTLGERLKNLKPSQLPELDEIWQAHRLRNDIALNVYEAALKRFELLD